MRMLFAFVLLLIALPLPAQKQKAPDPRTSPKATVIRPTTIYIQADASSQKLATISPGREIAILERGPQWLRVYANTDDETVRQQDQPVFTDHAPAPPISGWIETPAVIAADTPGGDAILFGVAIAAERAAAEPHAEPGDAQDALRLYRLTAQLFPQSARAPEAVWRSADIRWQIQKQDAATLPSAREQEPYLRQLPDESAMKQLEKQYPSSKWASFAAYELIDNKLCGDWQGQEKCPEKEAGYYTQFADRYQDSPRAPQALYEAAWRLACAGDLWTADDNEKGASEDRNRSVDIAKHLMARYGDTDTAAQGAALVYKVQQGIPVYGSVRQ